VVRKNTTAGHGTRNTEQRNTEVHYGIDAKREKFRKQHRGCSQRQRTRGNYVAFGDAGLQTLEPGWITGQQIEAARIAISRAIGRTGKILDPAFFPHKPVTGKPLEVRMGTGKGEPEYHCAVVKPGTVLFEVGGIPKAMARIALNKAANKDAPRAAAWSNACTAGLLLAGVRGFGRSGVGKENTEVGLFVDGGDALSDLPDTGPPDLTDAKYGKQIRNAPHRDRTGSPRQAQRADAGELPGRFTSEAMTPTKGALIKSRRREIARIQTVLHGRETLTRLQAEQKKLDERIKKLGKADPYDAAQRASLDKARQRNKKVARTVKALEPMKASNQSLVRKRRVMGQKPTGERNGRRRSQIKARRERCECRGSQ